jgi:hypothetical protein
MTTLLRHARGLFMAVMLCALAALFVPATVKGAALHKPGCCAVIKMQADGTSECPMHKQAPAHDQDSPCCQACALGLALLFVTPPDFVYAQTGETSLVSRSARSHSLPHRPPVPPPRGTLA